MNPDAFHPPIEAVPEHSEDPDRLHEVLSALLQARDAGNPILTEAPPEKAFVDMVTRMGQELGDDSFALHAIFFVTMLDLQQNTEWFFRRITNWNQLQEYSWIFQPNEVVARAARGIDIEAACSAYLRPSGHSRIALSQWLHNCTFLAQNFEGDLRLYFAHYGNNAGTILDALIVKPRAKSYQKPDFRRYGPNTGTLALQRIYQYGLYIFTEMEKIGVPVDFHLGRILWMTRVLLFNKAIPAHTLVYHIAGSLLNEYCRETGVPSQVVSDILWAVGARACNHRSHDTCPICHLCNQQLMSRVPYERNGLFDPKTLSLK